MPLRGTLSNTWARIQGQLFPWLQDELGPLTDRHKQLIAVLEMVGIEAFVQTWRGLPGRPLADRHALARAFAAKAVLRLPTTTGLIERLKVDKTLRRLCGWERPGQVPSEATFSRAFAEFADSGLPARVHEALIGKTHADRLVGHISRDATAIEVREKPAKAEASKQVKPKRRRGRPRKGEAVEKKEPPTAGTPSRHDAARDAGRICRPPATPARSAMPKAMQQAGSATSCILTSLTATFRCRAF